MIRAWGEANGIRVSNVAGPRERSSPGIRERAAEVLRQLLENLGPQPFDALPAR